MAALRCLQKGHESGRSGRLISQPERDRFGFEIHMHFPEHSLLFPEILRWNPASLNALPTSLSAEG
jgi:hypothetical protein